MPRGCPTRTRLPNAIEMNAPLEARIRAASAELAKPGGWHLAIDQLDQIVMQLVGASDPDATTVHLALDQLQILSQWAGVMSPQELRRVNNAILRLNALSVH
jgi:hypothetical protein